MNPHSASRVRWTRVLVCAALLSGADCNTDRIPGAIYHPPAERDSAFSIHSPFWSVDGSRIFFFGHVFGLPGYDLYAVDPLGGVACMLMRDSTAKRRPILSPDGTRIAYLAAELGRHFSQAHVWVMHADGTHPRDLTPFFSNWENIQWSPDSRAVVFEGGVEDSGAINYQIVRADVETGEIRMLTRGLYGNRFPCFMRDGRRIAYLSGRISTPFGGKIWVMDADGSNPRPVDTTSMASTSPRPSPTDNTLYFYRGLANEPDRGIYSVNIDSVELPASPSSFRFLFRENYLSAGQISPDGFWLASVEAFNSPRPDLVLLSFDPVGHRRVTTNYDVYLFSEAWSRDARRLVFDASDDKTTNSFFVYDVTGGTPRKLQIRRP
ncbi:MAG: hypothetical protein WB626_01745 [Bacteroidota bacterium]